MPFDPEKHHRRSIRLKEYDYAHAGIYFVTLCAYQKECLFGAVAHGEVVLHEYGCIVEEEWNQSATIRREIELDDFIVMPNHLHGIVVITPNPVGATGRSPVYVRDNFPHGPFKRSLGALVAGFKAASGRRINLIRQKPGTPVWQRNYYEHILRNEESLEFIRAYIQSNPMKWALDDENPFRG